MSLELRRRAELSASQVAALEAALSAFYRNPPASYYQIADLAAGQYNSQELPFHCDLVERVFPRATVLEVGCGTAHLCSYVEQKGGTYTGLDHSESLLQDNQRRFPRARFLSINAPPSETFDIVASLYTIEHVVDPPGYLERMWRYCRPGGLMAIICPEFVDTVALAPSVFYGRTPRRLLAKVRRLNFIDAAWHLFDLKVSGRSWKKQSGAAPPGAFWINLRPAILHGAAYGIDTDAVHMVRLKDLVWFFEQKGGAILQTSARMPQVPLDILRFNCYVVAQKPLSPGGTTPSPV